MSQDIAALRATYEAAEQGHVFTYWDKLSDAERVTFAQQLRSIDPAHLNKIFQQALDAEKAALSAKDVKVEPPPAESTVSTVGDAALADKYRQRGLDAIATGEVGVLLLAGGQGTRLGSSAPKGCFDIHLPSHKSLFQLQAERIARLQALAAAHGNKPSIVIPWYVMTSGPTREPTCLLYTSPSPRDRG